MIDWILAFKFNSVLALFIYWVPVGLCAYGYTLRTWKNFREDVHNQSSASYYRPTDTIGTIIGRGLVSIIPVANLSAACFDVAPEVFGDIFRWLGKVFDQPLVPDNDKFLQERAIKNRK